MVDIKYANAFSEVLEIIFHLSEEEHNKIPEKFIRQLEENSNKEYEFDYDPEKTLDEQNVLDETKTIIALICRDYLLSKEEREEIIEKEKEELKLFEEEQAEKYSYDKLFNKKINIDTETKELTVVEEDGFWIKLINRIKNFLKIK